MLKKDGSSASNNRNPSVPGLVWRHLRLLLTGCFLCGLVLFLYVGSELSPDKPISFVYPTGNPTWSFPVFFNGAIASIQSVFSRDRKREPKLILLWTTYFGSPDWLPNPSKLNCPISNCDVTSNRSLLANSSVVLFHFRDVGLDDLPRYPDENLTHTPIWALYNQEAPPNTAASTMKRLKGKIHWTITYRTDSDIFAPYGSLSRRTESYVMPELDPNRDLVCWMVSNCHTDSKRESYVEQMRHHIPVQIYGKCGKKSCPMKERLQCYRWLGERCKFYLSFENSLCKDYATEKLFHALDTNMVPVVLGGSNYTSILPNNSVVNAADFSSPEELSEFLINLGKDNERYATYFRWKRDFIAHDRYRLWLCDLCKKLHDTENDDIPVYEDLVSWWYDGSKCKTSWRT